MRNNEQRSKSGNKGKMHEMGALAKGIWTAVLSLLCVAIIIFLLWDPFSGILVEDKFTFSFGNDSVESTYRYFDYFYALQWIALGCLAFILWMWRGKLGIDGLGPIHGSSEPEIKQDVNSELKKETDLTSEQNDAPLSVGGGKVFTSGVSKGDKKISVGRNVKLSPQEDKVVGERETPNRQKESSFIITQTFSVEDPQKELTKELENFNKKVVPVFDVYKRISVEDLAKRLGHSPSYVYRMLRINKNLYRLDGKGIKSAVTMYNSPENMVLDKIYEELSMNGYLRQYREAIVNDSRIDAIFRSDSDIYLISLKSVGVSRNKNVVAKEVSMLNKVSKGFNDVETHLMIIFVGPIDEKEKSNRMAVLYKHCGDFPNLEIKFMNPRDLFHEST